MAKTFALLDAHGRCEDCGEEWGSRNAVALASQHHRKTGHRVWVEQTQRFSWGDGAARAPLLEAMETAG